MSLTKCEKCGFLGVTPCQRCFPDAPRFDCGCGCKRKWPCVCGAPNCARCWPRQAHEAKAKAL